MNELNDQKWMQLALQQAQKAASLGEVPVGAVLVDANNQLIASAHNAPISQHDPTSHAEINVLRKAAKILGNYRLVNTTLYVTLEPCIMCVGALLQSRIKRLVYAASEPKMGAIKSQFQLLDSQHNHVIAISDGVLREPCSELLSDFFKARRKQKKQAKEQQLTSS